MTASSQRKSHAESIRPVNLRTDLAQLADLIELVFRDRMDENGRAAISEMRYLSKMGPGLNVIGRVNDLASGISQGYVKVIDGRVVGNVSIYPANWDSEIGKAWMIANVGTHPDYRKRGIARELMHASMEFLQQKGATDIILQVDYDNHHAIALYESLGFIRERAFIKWRRSGFIPAPSFNRDLDDIFITQLRRSEWQKAYNLAQHTRPNEKGGIGWLHPLHIKDFRPSLMTRIADFFSIGSVEKLIVRDDDTSDLLVMLWVERAITLRQTKLTLLRQPDTSDRYAEALLGNVLRRYSSSGFVLEHPHDDTPITDLLLDYRFRAHRTVWHMRYHFD